MCILRGTSGQFPAMPVVANTGYFFIRSWENVRLCLWSQVGRYPSMSVVTKKPDDMSSEVGTSPSVASKPGVFKEISSCVCGDRHVDFFLTLTKMFLCLVAT